MICLACGWRDPSDRSELFIGLAVMMAASEMCPRRYLEPHDDAHNRCVVAALLALGWDAITVPSSEIHRKAIESARRTRP